MSILPKACCLYFSFFGLKTVSSGALIEVCAKLDNAGFGVACTGLTRHVSAGDDVCAPEEDLSYTDTRP